MSWTDSQSIRIIEYLRTEFKAKNLIETGTFKGINAQLHSRNFMNVQTCENEQSYFDKASMRLKDCHNVRIVKQNSPDFLREQKEVFHEGVINIFYLDAHFYDVNLPKEKRFVIKDELKSLEGYGPSVIIIHDFDNGLGHIEYDGTPLDMKMVKPLLEKIHKFKYYTNTLAGCEIVKPNLESITNANLPVDEDVIGNLEYAWSKPDKTFRGILYALPSELTKEEIKFFKLRKWN